MDKKKTQTRAPDLEKYLDEHNSHNFASYSQGARIYSLNYWTFVRLAKEAGAAWPLRKTAIVDLNNLDEYMEDAKRMAVVAGKGLIMAKRNEIENIRELVVGQGKKYVRYDEGAELFSVGVHTFQKWAKQANAVYKINGVVLVNIEKVERFVEAFEVQED